MTSGPRILLTGVGSLVGVGLLDVLANRRDAITLVGADADAHAWGLHQCDEQVVIPMTDDASYREAIENIVLEHDIELVIPCRDPDAVVVARANDDRDSAVLAAMGPAELVLMTFDKMTSAVWCKAHGIPFAPTILMSHHDAAADVAALVKEFGFPLIAKPRHGSGSLGVRVLVNEDQVAACLNDPRMVVQPFYEAPPAADLVLDTTTGLPLFHEIPVANETNSMVCVGRDGSLSPVCAHSSQLRLGRIESMERLTSHDLLVVVTDCAERFSAAGWRGPLNATWRWTGTRWVAIEFNPRFSGGTSGRTRMGYDEVRWMINDWFGAEVIKPWIGEMGDRMVRYLRDEVDPRPWRNAPSGISNPVTAHASEVATSSGDPDGRIT